MLVVTERGDVAQVDVRARTDEDVPALCALAAAVRGHGEQDARAWLERDVEQETAAFVAVVEGQVAGQATLLRPRPTFVDFLTAHGIGVSSTVEVARVFVDPQLRRRGIGTMLIVHAMASATEVSMEPMALIMEGNVASQEMFSRAGLAKIGWFDGIDGRNLVYAPVNRW